MEFLIFSDSHGRKKRIEEALARQIRPIDAVFFLGDGVGDLDDRVNGIPVIRVRGNCDWSLDAGSSIREEETVCFEGHRILLTHGHRQGVKSGLGGLIRAARERNAEIVLYGHTHAPALEWIPTGTEIGGEPMAKPICCFNPGSIAEGSFGTLTLTPETVLFAHGRL